MYTHAVCTRILRMAVLIRAMAACVEVSAKPTSDVAWNTSFLCAAARGRESGKYNCGQAAGSGRCFYTTVE
jgi:hypothetical protein